MGKLADKVNQRRRGMRLQPPAVENLRPSPMLGLQTLYQGGFCPTLKAGDLLTAFLVPGPFAHGVAWLTLLPGDGLELTLLVNGAEVVGRAEVREGMNRLELPLALFEGDKLQLQVTGGKPAREVWWGLQLNRGLL